MLWEYSKDQVGHDAGTGKNLPTPGNSTLYVCAFLQEFIEELLSPPFGGLVAFVKEAEALIERGQAERLRGEEGLRMGWIWWGEGKGEWKRKIQGCRLHGEGVRHERGGRENTRKEEFQGEDGCTLGRT